MTSFFLHRITLCSTENTLVPRPSEVGGEGGKCEPNLDLLKKMKEPRLALSMLRAHMLQAISDSLFSSILIDSFPNF